MSGGLKVAHLVMSLDCGGMERIVIELVREGRQRGQSVSIVCLERPGTLAQTAESLGARVYCVNKRPGIRPSTFGRVNDVLRQIQPDVIHSHTIGALFYCGPAAKAMGVPVVIHTEHINNIEHPLASRFVRCRRRWLWWWSARCCQRVVCVSRDIADGLARGGVVPRSKLRVLLNGIDTARIAQITDAAGLRVSLGIPPAAPVIGTVGRLNPVKCQDLLIRAFSRLKTRFPNAHLVLVGDGPSRGALEGLVSRLALDGSVHIVGYQPEPHRYLHIMNVFALTGTLEGLPLALLEAGAAGLPVVATSVGGVPDLIRDGEDGLLFSSGDEGALESLLSDLLADPARAQRIGEAARQKVVAEFDLARMAADYHRHYTDLLEGTVVAPATAEVGN